MITATATAAATATATSGQSVTQQIVEEWPGVLLGYGVEKAEDVIVWVWHTLNGPGGCG